MRSVKCRVETWKYELLLQNKKGKSVNFELFLESSRKRSKSYKPSKLCQLKLCQLKLCQLKLCQLYPLC
jgi:hypothetical protein